MHEYSLMENVIHDILDQLKENPLNKNEYVKEVALKVGALEIHSEESFIQAFCMLVKDTPLANCQLKLTIEPGTLKCEGCGYNGPCPADQGDGHDPTPVAECPECGKINRIIDGRGIQTIDLITAAG